jgi:hypothetical protein
VAPGVVRHRGNAERLAALAALMSRSVPAAASYGDSPIRRILKMGVWPDASVAGDP